eukprot:jgi/Picre1/31971/NNA_007319.t1
MLTSFIEERPVKRLKGQPEVYDDSSGNTSCKTSPEQGVFDDELAGILPAKTPALNLVNDSFAPGAERVEKEDVVENVAGNDAEGFFIFSQPGYERGASQHVIEDVDEASTPCKSSDELDRNDSEIDLALLNSGFSTKSYGEEGDLGSQPTAKKSEDPKTDDPNSRLTPAVHSADRVQLNQAGPSYFPIFRSKKDCKIVYIIRHGESEFNAACSARGSSWEDPLLFDARLTWQGRKQALSLRNEVLKWDLPKDALWITSPLTRAIETMLHVHPAVKHGDFSCARSTILENVMVLPEVTERLHTSGDIGRSPADLASDFPMLHSQLKHLSDTWWYSKKEKPNCPYRRLFQSHEPKDSINRRIRQFRKWIIDRPEKAFVAVGHSMFWKDFATACHNGIKQETLRNCEWKIIHV